MARCAETSLAGVVCRRRAQGLPIQRSPLRTSRWCLERWCLTPKSHLAPCCTSCKKGCSTLRSRRTCKRCVHGVRRAGGSVLRHTDTRQPTMRQPHPSPQDGSERACDEPFHLLVPHLCRVKPAAGSKTAGGKGGEGREGGGRRHICARTICDCANAVQTAQQQRCLPGYQTAQSAPEVGRLSQRQLSASPAGTRARYSPLRSTPTTRTPAFSRLGEWAGSTCHTGGRGRAGCVVCTSRAAPRGVWTDCCPFVPVHVPC